MNMKFFIVSVVTLLLGTTSVMADNHKHHDGPQKPKKEVVQKQNKKDNKKDKHSKNDRHYDSKAKHNAPKPQAAKPACKPNVVAHKAPAKHKPAPHMHQPKPGCGPDGRHAKDCHKCHSCHGHHHSGHCKPMPPRPVKNHVRVVPPIAPFQVTVRI